MWRLKRSQFLRTTDSCCVAITLGSLLHEIGRYGPVSSFLESVGLLLVDEAQQAGQAAYVAVHGAVPRSALTVHVGDDRQTRGASGNDPVRAEVLQRLGHKRVALHLLQGHHGAAIARKFLQGQVWLGYKQGPQTEQPGKHNQDRTATVRFAGAKESLNTERDSLGGQGMINAK